MNYLTLVYYETNDELDNLGGHYRQYLQQVVQVKAYCFYTIQPDTLQSGKQYQRVGDMITLFDDKEVSIWDVLQEERYLSDENISYYIHTTVNTILYYIGLQTWVNLSGDYGGVVVHEIEKDGGGGHTLQYYDKCCLLLSKSFVDTMRSSGSFRASRPNSLDVDIGQFYFSCKCPDSFVQQFLPGVVAFNESSPQPNIVCYRFDNRSMKMQITLFQSLGNKIQPSLSTNTLTDRLQSWQQKVNKIPTYRFFTPSITFEKRDSHLYHKGQQQDTHESFVSSSTNGSSLEDRVYLLQCQIQYILYNIHDAPSLCGQLLVDIIGSAWLTGKERKAVGELIGNMGYFLLLVLLINTCIDKMLITPPDPKYNNPVIIDTQLRNPRPTFLQAWYSCSVFPLAYTWEYLQRPRPKEESTSSLYVIGYICFGLFCFWYILTWENTLAWFTGSIFRSEYGPTSILWVSLAFLFAHYLKLRADKSESASTTIDQMIKAPLQEVIHWRNMFYFRNIYFVLSLLWAIYTWSAYNPLFILLSIWWMWTPSFSSVLKVEQFASMKTVDTFDISAWFVSVWHWLFLLGCLWVFCVKHIVEGLFLSSSVVVITVTYLILFMTLLFQLYSSPATEIFFS